MGFCSLNHFVLDLNIYFVENSFCYISLCLYATVMAAFGAVYQQGACAAERRNARQLIDYLMVGR